MQQRVDDLGTYPTEETLTNVLWRSLVFDDEGMMGSEYRGQWAKLCSILRQCEDLCHKFISFSQAKSSANRQEVLKLRQEAQKLDRNESEISSFISSFQTFGRSFSSTKRGYVGWMPKETGMGDELWLFHGCRVPFVLRPAKDRQGDERAYRLIGECYLHGLMRPGASARIAGETQQIKLV